MEYHSLGHNEIRVLRLDKHLRNHEHWGQIPSAVLETAVLDDELVFHAISYVWGDALEKRAMLVDGVVVMVTANLQKALRDVALNLRVTEDESADDEVVLEDYPIWADAICMNQADDEEKSQQVARMGEIYAKASRVLVFLKQSTISPEEEEKSCQRAFCVLKILATLRYDEEYATLLDSIEPEARPFSREECDRYQTCVRPLLNCNLLDTEALHSLSTGPWWRRAWILQEIALAREMRALVVLGPRCIAWHTFLDAMGWTRHDHASIGFENRRKLSEGISPHGQDIWGAIDKTSTALNDLTLSFQNTYMRRRGMFNNHLASHLEIPAREATLPQDTVYALLSLISDREDCGIIPDYTKPWQEVFREVSIYVLRRKGSRALQLMGIETLRDDDFASPQLDSSWVTNWAKHRRTTPLQFWPMFSPEHPLERIFNASMDRGAWWYSVSDWSLRLRVYHVGTIDRIAALPRFEEAQQDEMAGGRQQQQQFQRSRAWLWKFGDFLQTCHGLSADQRANVWRVPIADMSEHSRVYPWLKRGYDMLCGNENLDQECGDEFEVAEYATSLEATVGGGDVRRTYHKDRAIFTAGNGGYLALGSGTVRVGDLVCVVAGVDIPLVLRNAGDGRFRIIEEAYVQGIMDGEFVAGGADLEEIVIV